MENALDATRALREWLAAVPADVATTLPPIPGVSLDWLRGVEESLQRSSNSTNVPEKSCIGAAFSGLGTSSVEGVPKSVPSTPLTLHEAAQYALDWLDGEDLNMAHDVVHHLQMALASTGKGAIPAGLIDELAERHGLDSFVYMPFSRALESAILEHLGLS